MPRGLGILRLEFLTTRGTENLAHQYDFMNALKDHCDFSWVIQHRRGFNFVPRGDFLTELGVKEVPYFEEGKHDIAILHLDQQCVEESLWDRGKGSLYKELNQTITGVPKIVVMHGTPYYPEKMNDIEMCEKVKNAVGKNWVVCNSHTARLQWAFGLGGAALIKKRLAKGKTEEEAINIEPKVREIGVPLKQITTIIHGIDEGMFRDLPKEPRVTTFISAGGLDKYYDRAFFQAVKELLQEKNISHCHISVDQKFVNFEDYRDFLGGSLVYFNPTKESCMPRARTEAMLSGCCVVTTDNQDEETFIEHGKNGFLIPRVPQKAADLIEALILEYKMAKKVGEEGRKTALEKFTYNRYRKDWLKLLRVVLKDRMV